MSWHVSQKLLVWCSYKLFSLWESNDLVVQALGLWELDLAFKTACQNHCFFAFGLFEVVVVFFVCLLFNGLLLYWKCWAVLSGKVILGYGFILTISLIWRQQLCPNSQGCCGDHTVLMVNHTWGTSWLQLTNPKKQKKLLSPLFSSSPARFFLTAPAYELFRLPGCLGSGCLVLPCESWALEGAHTFSNWELDYPIRRALLKLAKCDPLAHWSRLLFSLWFPQRFWMTPGSPSHPGLKIPHLWAPRRHNMKSTSIGVRMSVLR